MVDIRRMPRKIGLDTYARETIASGYSSWLSGTRNPVVNYIVPGVLSAREGTIPKANNDNRYGGGKQRTRWTTGVKNASKGK